ncbi:MAG TPA: response regulator transcription factor [Acidimicrobiales bacterium]|nr:response regulator transcription factor [Acidimicrobiales bacterium]
MSGQEDAPIAVVLVDDTDLVLNSLVRILRGEHGIEVVGTAANVHDMLDMVGQHHVDVVVTDYMLPDGDGISATRPLKERSPGTKVLILTGWGPDTDMANRAREAGCDGILPKSLDIHGSLVRYIERARLGEFVTSDSDPLLP